MALEVVTQLLTLSEDPEYRPFIVRDQGCLPGLVMFLENNDAEVVLKALRTLANLSEHKDNKEAMAREPGLVTGLKVKLTATSPKVAELAASALTNVSEYIITEPATPVKTFSAESYRTPLKHHNEVVDQVSLSVFSEKVAIKLSNAKTHTFYIKGMNNFTKQKVEETLVGVKGVVSFLIDVHTHKAIVRTMTSPEDIIGAIKVAGLTATYGEEEGENKENDPQSPQYLPEFAAQQAAAQKGKGWGWGSIVSFGATEKPQPRNTADQKFGWNSVVRAIWG